MENDFMSKRGFSQNVKSLFIGTRLISIIYIYIYISHSNSIYNIITCYIYIVS